MESPAMTQRNTILVGDVREQLRLIHDESVHCVVTSPPYWGLRDYGTALWDGGDTGCDHKPPFLPRNERRREGLDGGLSSVDAADAGTKAYRDACGKCGARRIDSQLGLEATPEEYVASMVAVFREVRRVLRKDGTCWVNLGDSYAAHGRMVQDVPMEVGSGAFYNPTKNGNSVGRVAGYKPKDLIGIPWRVAFALQADGWWLRSDIIWSKPNPMPESVTDRPTKSHEYLFLLTKSERYFYDAEAVRESAAYGFSETRGLTPHEKYDASAGSALQSPTRAPNRVIPGTGGTRNRRTVWEIATEPYAEAHFATYPTELVKPCILAGTSEHGCCSVCGAPWERVVETTKYEPPTAVIGERNVDMSRGDKTRKLSGADYNAQVSIRTTGWRPTCKHEAPLTPCLVLDPFLGSGTTALVAKTAGRDWLGIELNPTYAEMAKRRINVDQERLL